MLAGAGEVMTPAPEVVWSLGQILLGERWHKFGHHRISQIWNNLKVILSRHSTNTNLFNQMILADYLHYLDLNIL